MTMIGNCSKQRAREDPVFAALDRDACRKLCAPRKSCAAQRSSRLGLAIESSTTGGWTSVP
jgi:hypothetical protein